MLKFWLNTRTRAAPKHRSPRNNLTLEDFTPTKGVSSSITLPGTCLHSEGKAKQIGERSEPPVLGHFPLLQNLVPGYHSRCRTVGRLRGRFDCITDEVLAKLLRIEVTMASCCMVLTTSVVKRTQSVSYAWQTIPNYGTETGIFGQILAPPVSAYHFRSV